MSNFQIGGQGHFGVAPTPQYVQPQDSIQRQAYPPAPNVQRQDKPSQISMRDFKYNAINVDNLDLNITARGGFDGVKPDMMIWNFYQYNVDNFQANANEVELSKFVDFYMQELGISDTKIDFHPDNRVTLSGSYPLMGLPVPFSADVKITTTTNDKIMFTIEDFSTGFRIPSQLRDTLLGLIINGEDEKASGPPPSSPADAFSMSDAMYRVGSNQIVLDFNRMQVPLNLPIKEVKTDAQGFRIVGGLSYTEHPRAEVQSKEPLKPLAPLEKPAPEPQEQPKEPIKLAPLGAAARQRVSSFNKIGSLAR